MRIIIDGDATPSIKLIELAAESNNIEVIIYTDYSHNINSSYSKVITLEIDNQSVDIAISNNIKENDILVTQDYGLALIALSKKAKVINPNGIIYTNDNIESLLYTKYINSKLRKQNKHIKGPKKRTKENDEKLILNLIKLINT